MKKLREMFGGFGYYAALLAVVVGIGAGAYAIKNRPVDVEPAVPIPDASLAANPLDERLDESKTPPKLGWPVSGRDIITPHSPDEPVWSQTLEMFCTHRGVDIAATLGEAVRAASGGEVVAIYKDEMLGNTIEIVGTDGVRVSYSNLSTLNLVKIGQSVRRADVISAVGQSSNFESAMGPHLHFEAFDNGMWLELP